MKKEAIDFNVEVKDAFGEVVKDKGNAIMLNVSIVNILSHPQALPEEKKMDSVEIVKRLSLQQKVASKTPQIYSTDELSVIRESVVIMYNKRMLNVELAGTILKITE